MIGSGLSDRREFYVACFVGLFFSLMVGLQRPERTTDFNQFYSAARLAGTGRLYDWESLRVLEQQHGAGSPFGRLPVYAAAYKILSVLPYPIAAVAWLLASVCAAVGFWLLWPFAQRAHALLAICWSFPLAVLLSSGQDTSFFLLFMAAGVWLLEARKDTWAGLVFSLGAAKFHLAMGVPIVLLARRNWNALTGGAIGCVVLLSFSFAIEGLAWPRALLDLSRLPEFSPAPYKMPNLHGLVYWLPGSGAVEAILSAFVLLALYLIARAAPLSTVAAGMLAAGLLVSHHAYLYDAVLLIPILLLVHQVDSPAAMRYWSIFLCMPVIYALMLHNPLWSAVARALIAGFPLVTLAWMMRRSGHRCGAVAARPG